LVVVSIIALLVAILLPALSRAKQQAYAVKCASHQKQWGLGSLLYTMDHQDNLPFFSDVEPDPAAPSTVRTVMWFEMIGPYVAETSRLAGLRFYEGPAWYSEFRRCPGGRPTDVVWNCDNWDCWVGVYFDHPTDGSPLAPYYYKNVSPGIAPTKLTKVRSSASKMVYLDTRTHYLYSPLRDIYTLNYDSDLDGYVDSIKTLVDSYAEYYNGAQAKIHLGGCNVTLLDGHVERVAYEELWEMRQVGSRWLPVHPFFHFRD
jgi:prepilin-type processing-associated H-X9-DG protein